MLEIVLAPKSLGASKSGALGLSLFCLMVNPRLSTAQWFQLLHHIVMVSPPHFT